MAEEIRVEYEQLEQIAGQFAKQAAAVGRMQQQLKGRMGPLQSGWIGKGSSAFFAEMNDKVLPATARLVAALEEASKTTRQIAQLMEAAERDAAAPFCGGERAGEVTYHPAVGLLGCIGAAVGISAAIVGGTGIVSNLYRSLTATQQERAQIKAVREELKNVKGLKPEEWNKLDATARLEVLRQVEAALAKAAGRERFDVRATDLPEGMAGLYDGAAIWIDSQALERGNLHENLTSLAHEARHAYQDYALHHLNAHDNEDELKLWSGDWTKSHDPKVIGMKRYWNLPTERDARHFADQFADTLAPRSPVTESLEEAVEVLTGV